MATATSKIDGFLPAASIQAGDIVLGLRGGTQDLSIDIYAAISELISLKMPSVKPFGLTISWVGTTSFSVDVGSVGDKTLNRKISIESAITKTTSSWAVGTGSGGKLSAAAIANNTFYGVYLIHRSDTNITDVGFDVSLTTPTLPTNYDYSRRIGYFLTDGSGNILKFFQNGREFYLDVKVVELNAVSPSNTTRNLKTVSIPPGSIGIFDCIYVDGGVANSYLDIGHTQRTDAAASASNFVFHTVQTSGVTVAGRIRVPVDSSKQIYYRTSNGSSATTLLSSGWVDEI